MRLWSIHPKYLDSIGLIALWRESLLAKKVLEGKTNGYKKHPQLERFKKSKHPLKFINSYISYMFEESLKRGFNFDSSKFNNEILMEKIPVNKGQIDYEFKHLLKKMKQRCPQKAKEIKMIRSIETNPIFYSVVGGIEDWERPKIPYS